VCGLLAELEMNDFDSLANAYCELRRTDRLQQFLRLQRTARLVATKFFEV